MDLILGQETALNLTLEGSVGSFSLGDAGGAQNTIDVRYFLTHIGLDGSASNEAILSHIAPVREIFDFEQLEFDEIMQRDIDDARVSSELVPYLLDNRFHDLVKLFPPIVVVVLPLQPGANRPADLYPPVLNYTKTAPAGQHGYSYQILRSGAVGEEVFQFEQPIADGKIRKHDLVRLKLNTNKVRLVIVDGQHRAMALLALYRNLKDQWSDERRAAFREYYAEWTPNYIQQFKLDEINLPVMLCTFPRLDASFQGDFDLKRAARAIFLILNKTARKVSQTRNILLDDNDLIAEFLRTSLSSIKKKDSGSAYSLRIHNVELDQAQDRIRIADPIAITGVSHVYYLIEHLMLNKGEEDVNGAKPRAGRFAWRNDLATYGAYTRLDGLNLLGMDAANATKRHSYTRNAALLVAQSFSARYGRYIVGAYEQFVPFEVHNRAVLSLRAELHAETDRKLLPILFEGQGIGEVFERHRANLKEKLSEGYFEHDVPQIREVLNKLDGTARRKAEHLRGLRRTRAQAYFTGVGVPKNQLNAFWTFAESWLDATYSSVYTTVAFQAALVCGFFREAERAYGLDLQGFGVEPNFGEYLQQVSRFFVPESLTEFQRLVRVLNGELITDQQPWSVARTTHSFREVVFRGEMKPDQWPKYAYLLTEIWSPTDSALSAAVDATRDKARKQIFGSLQETMREEYCRIHAKLEKDLTDQEHEQILIGAYDALSTLITNVGSKPPAIEAIEARLKQDFDTARRDEATEE